MTTVRISAKLQKYIGIAVDFYKTSRDFFKDSFVYGVSSGVENVLRLVLIPIYIRGLTTEEFGAYGLIEVFINTMIWIVNGGIHSAIVRFGEKYEKKAPEYLATGLVMTIVSGGFSIVLFSFFASPLSRVIIGKETYKGIFILGSYLLPLMMIKLSIEGIWRIRGYSVFLSFYRIIITAVELGAALLFISKWRQGLNGLLYARLAANSVAAIVGLIYFGISFKIKDIKIARLGPMLKYSLPLIPHRVAIQLNTGAVRYILQIGAGLNAVGIYTMAYKVAAQTNLLLTPISEAFEAYVYNNYKSIDGKYRIQRASLIFISWVTFVGIVVFLLAPWLIRFFDKSGSYNSAVRIVGILVIGMIFDGYYRIASFGIFLKKATYLLPFITGLTVVINIGLGIYLIRAFGLDGAAIAFVISILVKFLISYWQTMKIFPVKIEKGFIIGCGITLLLFIYAFISR